MKMYMKHLLPWLGKDFLDMYQKHYPQKKKKMITQISSKCKASVKDTLKRIKRKATDQKKIFANYTFTRNFVKYL